MKYLIFILLFTSCASSRLSYSQKVDVCIEKYIDKNVKALDAVQVCEAIHGKKI